MGAKITHILSSFTRRNRSLGNFRNEWKALESVVDMRKSKERLKMKVGSCRMKKTVLVEEVEDKVEAKLKCHKVS